MAKKVYLPRELPALRKLYHALDYRSRIGELIRAARNEQGITALALAKELKIPRSRVSEWERGKTEPRKDSLQEIFDLLDVSDWMRFEVEELVRAVRMKNQQRARRRRKS